MWTRVIGGLCPFPPEGVLFGSCVVVICDNDRIGFLAYAKTSVDRILWF